MRKGIEKMSITIDLEKFECIEDGRKAQHLHGNKYGLEPCCGQHPDCDLQEAVQE